MISEEQVLECILTRRSVRKYRPDKIPAEILDKIINAGIHAPSALSKQPWRFLAVSDADLLNRISDYVKPLIYEKLKDVSSSSTKRYLELIGSENFSLFFSAPLLVVVLGDNKNPLSDIDCSLCAENMMLAAHAMGIGSCWIGSARMVEYSMDLMSELDIPEGFHIVAPVVFGYPDENPGKPEKNSPVVYWR
ncbi:MAG: nitroreductase [Methanomicrobiaceae archaeon]|nr:nitroreductase [Methanomicrobiaceae archaeon]